MTQARKVLLDPHGDNVPPHGYTIIADEVGLVQHALEAGPLFVRGQRLCQWAEDLGVGRGWRTTRLSSPTQELANLCPDLSPNEARSIVDRLATQLDDLHRPLHLYEVLVARWGDAALWNEAPTSDHAFRWLMWLAQRTADDADLKLVRRQAKTWEATAELALQRAYAPRSVTDAWMAIKQWLRVLPSSPAWPPSPEVPLECDLQRRLEEDLTEAAAETDTDFFAALLERAPQRHILLLAAQQCANVLLNNPRKLSPERVRRLEPYLTYDRFHELITLVPPEDPGLPEWSFDQIKNWFTTKYLPYRDLSSRPDSPPDPHDWIANHALEFARQFLEYFAAARIGGDGSQHLAWTKSQRLRDRRQETAHLLVILDGLAYPDGERLRTYIGQETRRLFLDNVALALAPLPTVTEFAKPAVALGMPPSEATENTAQGLHSSEEEVASALQRAMPGDIVVWRHIEPDQTYHFRAHAGPQTVRARVEAQLLILAKQIVRVAVHVPDRVRLRVVVTTDHGRLLTSTERNHPIPMGMTAHGRAAWGKHDVRIDESGFKISDGVAYLHPSRFDLPPDQVYAVLVADEAFLTADDRGGVEPFPHGGLMPEEVLIPWMEFTRDREPVKVACVLSGKGQEGRDGVAHLSVANLGPVSIEIAGLTLVQFGTSITVSGKVGPYDKQSFPVRLPKWPSKEELVGLTVSLQFALPDGARARYEFAPELEIESLYNRPDLLRELGGF